MRLVLATRNDHKVRELGRMLDGVTIEPLPGDVTLPPEDGDTFAANALGKARAAAAALGRPAIADDSGIEAAALGGAPGIYSARFAGPDATDADNLAKLRAEAPAGSALRYVCVMAYATPDGEERTFTGAARARSRPTRAGAAASATTRRSCPTTSPTAARWPSCPTPRRTRSRTAAARRARCSRGCATRSAAA